jgi:hypothetical protein
MLPGVAANRPNERHVAMETTAKEDRSEPIRTKQGPLQAA